MRIVTPTEIEDVAWEGYLQPQGDVYRSGTTLPRVTLGEPEWCPAEQALESETGIAWTPLSADRRYALVRLACTLHRPREDRSRYTDARLQAYLRVMQSSGPGTVVAYDLYPQRRSAEQKGAFTFSLGPDLKFAEVVDLSLVQVGAEIEYRQVYPVIQAFGLGESNPYWQFTHHATHPLLGSQWVYALLSAPAGAGGVRLSLEIVATLETRYGPLRVGLPEEARAHISRTVVFGTASGLALDRQKRPIAAIRELLEAVFTPQSLRRFCQDRPAFQPLLKEFSPDHGLADMVDRVISFCERKMLWDELLAGVREENPRQYARFADQLR